MSDSPQVPPYSPAFAFPATSAKDQSAAFKDDLPNAKEKSSVASSIRHRMSVFEIVQLKEQNKAGQIIRARLPGEAVEPSSNGVASASSPTAAPATLLLSPTSLSHARRVSAPMASIIAQQSAAAAAMHMTTMRRGTAPPSSTKYATVPANCFAAMSPRTEAIVAAADNSTEKVAAPAPAPAPSPLTSLSIELPAAPTLRHAQSTIDPSTFASSMRTAPHTLGPRSVSTAACPPDAADDIPDASVPICCARHAAFTFLAVLPPPPAYSGCPKLLVAPEKPNFIPGLTGVKQSPVTASLADLLSPVARPYAIGGTETAGSATPEIAPATKITRRHSVLVSFPHGSPIQGGAPLNHYRRVSCVSVMGSPISSNGLDSPMNFPLGSPLAAGEPGTPSIQAWIAEAQAESQAGVNASTPAVISSDPSPRGAPLSSKAAVGTLSHRGPVCFTPHSVHRSPSPSPLPPSTPHRTLAAANSPAPPPSTVPSSSTSATPLVAGHAQRRLSVQISGTTPTPPFGERTLAAPSSSSPALTPSTASPPLTTKQQPPPPLQPPTPHAHSIVLASSTPHHAPSTPGGGMPAHGMLASLRGGSTSSPVIQPQQSPPNPTPSPLAAARSPFSPMPNRSPFSPSLAQHPAPLPPPQLQLSSRLAPLIMDSPTPTNNYFHRASIGSATHAAAAAGGPSSLFSPPPPVPTFTPRSRSITTPTHQPPPLPQTPATPLAGMNALTPKVAGSPVLPPPPPPPATPKSDASQPQSTPPPLPPFIPRVASSPHGRPMSISAPTTPLSPSRALFRASPPSGSPSTAASTLLLPSRTLPIVSLREESPLPPSLPPMPPTPTGDVTPAFVAAPPASSPPSNPAVRRALLQQQLDEAIAQQEFERCISLRDQIKALELE